MNFMKKILASIFIISAMIGTVSVFLPVAAKAADANLTGNWLLVLNYKGNIEMHDMIISNQDQNGNLSGAGAFPHNEAYSITWKLENSQIKGNDVNLMVYYDNSDYIAKLAGVIQPNGFLAGDWTDNQGLKGKWSAAPKSASSDSGSQAL